MKYAGFFGLVGLGAFAVTMPAAARGGGMGMAQGRDMGSQPLFVGDLPTGTVSVRLGRGSLSNTAVDVEVTASIKSPDGKTSEVTEKTRADGRAIFSGLVPGSQFQAEATIDEQTLQTSSFTIPPQGGARLMLISSSGEQAAPGAPKPDQMGQLPPGHPAMPGGHGAPGMNEPDAFAGKERTGDASVLRLAPTSRMVIDLREEALSVLQNLVIENTSDKVFEPPAGGLLFPLPEGATGAEAIEGGTPLDVRDAIIRLTTPIPPKSSAMVRQVRFGFILPTDGRPDVEYRQPMPLGFPDPQIMVPAEAKLALQGPGLQALPSQADGGLQGILLYRLDPVPAGGVLRLSVGGLPSRSTTGQAVAAALFGAIVVAGIAGARRRRKDRSSRESDRRERLLSELAQLEQKRQKAEPADSKLDAQRTELMAELRETYRAASSERSADA